MKFKVVDIEKTHLLQKMEELKKHERFDCLIDLFAVDYPEKEKRFEVNYLLFSSQSLQRLQVKVLLTENEGIDSVCSLWLGANWLEREVSEMFGVVFKNHPKMQRLLTDIDMVGYPLRKKGQEKDEEIFLDNKNEEALRGQPLGIMTSHPSSHSCLRILGEMDGEKVLSAQVELGMLHRGVEKLAEQKNYQQFIPYTDRLNYNSAAMNNVGYCKVVEELLEVEIPLRAQAIRVIVCELSRLLDHLTCIGANAVDLGVWQSFYHLLVYREKIYDLFEKNCGARVTVSLTRIGGMAEDVSEEWLEDLLIFCLEVEKGIQELDQTLTKNSLWQTRTRGVGVISQEEALSWGYTGPCLRATGLGLDMRKYAPYYGYENIEFEVPIGIQGDAFDRYCVRVEEMRQSVSIIRQVVKSIPGGAYKVNNPEISLPPKKEIYSHVESLNHHFDLLEKGIRPEKGEVYDAIEAANGELGFYVVSDQSPSPYRLKIRPPGYAIYQSLSTHSQGIWLDDFITILSSMNVIASEIDR